MQTYNIRAEFIPVNFNKPAVLTTKTITQNGVYDAVTDNADGYSSVTVVVPENEPRVQELNVTPTTSNQTFTPSVGVDGFTPVNVSAVNATIDPNIQEGNIKDGVSILGVMGNYQGTTPTGTITITANGVYDVTDKATADVQVPTMPSVPDYYIEKTVDNSVLKNTSHLIDLSGFTNIDRYVLSHTYCFNTAITGGIVFSNLTQLTNAYACDYCFQGCTGITSVSMPLLSTVSGEGGAQSMFTGCTGITSVDLHSLTTVSGQNGCSSMFNGCTNLTSIDISSLTTISGMQGCYALVSSSKITSVDLSNLTTISGRGACNSMFNATKITSVNFSSLSAITGEQACQMMFVNCSDLTTLSFPALKTTSFGSYTNQFSNLILRCSNVTIHFPSNLQSVVSGLTGYPDFGGTNTTVLFDLPATE